MTGTCFTQRSSDSSPRNSTEPRRQLPPVLAQLLQTRHGIVIANEDIIYFSWKSPLASSHCLPWLFFFCSGDLVNPVPKHLQARSGQTSDVRMSLHTCIGQHTCTQLSQKKVRGQNYMQSPQSTVIKTACSSEHGDLEAPRCTGFSFSSGQHMHGTPLRERWQQ